MHARRNRAIDSNGFAGRARATRSPSDTERGERRALGRNLLAGAAAGAVGTIALDVATYLDMALRGRPSSSVPSDAAGKLAELAGVSLGGDDDTVANRRSGLGALFGYVTGVGVGVAYGALRSRVRVPKAVAAAGLGLAAMAGSNGPLVGLGLTDPGEWSGADWAADIVPHLVYGLFTALAYEGFSGAER
jgi:hypothetical protein